jgi:hypothetical protein
MLTTPYVAPLDRELLLDFRPSPDRAGEMWLLLRRGNWSAPRELVALRADGTLESLAAFPLKWSSAGGDGFVILPGGRFLVRVSGMFWIWRRGEQPRELGPGSPVIHSGGPENLAVTRDGRVALARREQDLPPQIYRFNPDDGTLSPIAGPGTGTFDGSTVDTRLNEVGGLDTTENGDLLIVDTGSHQIKKVDTSAW